ncbi:MAG TPA: multifunctional oxoglutarate decarboxylase/oxoglutarate dehydrogenase thiamine pyrophosphate-binding subunit/dihydrolipoyllysine-residue succinyltransferase subunit, partial [Thermoanaerobaculia bacterium]
MSASSPYGTNIAFIEELYDKYRENPLSVSASWREFFQDYEPEPGEEDGESGSDWAAQQEQLAQWMPEPAGAQAAAPAPVNAPAPAAKTEAPLPRPTAVPPPAPAPAAKPPAPPAEEKVTVPLRGAASKIVKNMEASLEVPTATSVRTIPVKVLEENRQVINHHLV